MILRMVLIRVLRISCLGIMVVLAAAMAMVVRLGLVLVLVLALLLLVWVGPLGVLTEVVGMLDSDLAAVMAVLSAIVEGEATETVGATGIQAARDVTRVMTEILRTTAVRAGHRGDSDGLGEFEAKHGE